MSGTAKPLKASACASMIWLLSSRLQAQTTPTTETNRPSSEQFRDQRRGARGPVGLDWPVIDLAPDLLGNRGGDLGGAIGLEVHAAAGAIAREPVAHVEVLLEVVAQREVEERPPAGGQLHRCGQAALDDRQVAGREVLIEVVDVCAHLEPIVLRQARR